MPKACYYILERRKSAVYIVCYVSHVKLCILPVAWRVSTIDEMQRHQGGIVTKGTVH